MEDRLKVITEVFKLYNNDLKIIKDFEVVNSSIIGEIEVIGTPKPDVIFKVLVHENYPLKTGSIESIVFMNESLKKYNHINYDGSVCFHTLTTDDLSSKLKVDIEALLEWKDRYYVDELSDDHFEYLFYDNQLSNHIFLFCGADNNLVKNDYGYFYFSKRSEFEGKTTFLVQSLKSEIDGTKFKFSWSLYYQDTKNLSRGLYYIAEKAPIYYRNFSFKNWSDFKDYFSDEFLKFLNDSKKNFDKRSLIENKFMPLLLGYPIGYGKFNFETLLINYYQIPVYKGELIEKETIWGKTVDSSYDIFFGRGKLNDSLCNRKILIVGLGALGSNLAESLVRGGCKSIDLMDFDIKEVGNICRGNFDFYIGERSKTEELKLKLISISPFVEIKTTNAAIHPIRSTEAKKIYEDFFNQYDYVFNCTASNDVNLILDGLEIKGQLFTLSISNHANELVCIIGNENVFNINSEIYSTIKQDTNDMFFPQGCWNPTFKASYHNIVTLVNYALSNIDYIMKEKKPLKNFMLEVLADKNYIINLKD
jgi:hypothetical protein